VATLLVHSCAQICLCRAWSPSSCPDQSSSCPDLPPCHFGLPHCAQINLRRARSPSSPRSISLAMPRSVFIMPQSTSPYPDLSSSCPNLSNLCVVQPRSTIFDHISTKIYRLKFRLKPNPPHPTTDSIQSPLRSVASEIFCHPILSSRFRVGHKPNLKQPVYNPTTLHWSVMRLINIVF